jgi:ribosome-associated toxin RatA of RatAB toxin-antitoxin module
MPVPQVHRSALIARPASLMYGLVNDVRSYPRWFDWCQAADVLAEDEHSMVARLGLKLGLLQTGFTTRNVLSPCETIQLTLVEGPLTRLRGGWSFKALSEDGCRVGLELSFEYASGWLDSAFRLGFERLANHMVDDFVRVAREHG